MGCRVFKNVAGVAVSTLLLLLMLLNPPSRGYRANPLSPFHPISAWLAPMPSPFSTIAAVASRVLLLPHSRCYRLPTISAPTLSFQLRCRLIGTAQTLSLLQVAGRPCDSATPGHLLLNCLIWTVYRMQTLQGSRCCRSKVTCTLSTRTGDLRK